MLAVPPRDRDLGLRSLVDGWGPAVVGASPETGRIAATRNAAAIIAQRMRDSTIDAVLSPRSASFGRRRRGQGKGARSPAEGTLVGADMLSEVWIPTS